MRVQILQEIFKDNLSFSPEQKAKINKQEYLILFIQSRFILIKFTMHLNESQILRSPGSNTLSSFLL